MKKQLIHFLNWMNRKAADEPMSLETDHEDIAMMYLAEYPIKEGNCPTCNSEVEIGGKEGETRWFVPKTVPFYCDTDRRGRDRCTKQCDVCEEHG